MLQVEDVVQIVTVIIAAPDREGNILIVISWEKSGKASRRLHAVLISFPFP